MIALYIIGIIIAIILFFVFGHYLWATARDKYGYNIFNLGVVLRGIIAAVCFWFGAAMIDAGDGSTTVCFFVAGILWIWTFLATASKTNVFIATFSLVYQLFAVVMIKSVINRILK